MGCFSNSSYKILPLPYLLAVPGKESGEQGLQVLPGSQHSSFLSSQKLDTLVPVAALQGKLFEDLCFVLISVVIFCFVIFLFLTDPFSVLLYLI